MSTTVNGLEKVLKHLKQFGEEVEEDIHVITGDMATKIVFDAKNNAPIDLGKLRQDIQSIELGKSYFKIKANSSGIAPYSAYMEFGTGRSVKVPSELQEIAYKFKGNGVKEVNIQPRPFLYPAFVKGREQYKDDLEDLLKDLTKKYSK